MAAGLRHDIAQDLAVNAQRTGALGFLAALLLNPSFQTTLCYRLSHHLAKKGKVSRALSRVVWRMGVSVSASYIHPSARIGPGLSLPHPTGIVIGAASDIGAGVTIYQNVTLGAKGGADMVYPRIDSGATIFAGACLIGGVRVGERAIIGANSVVLKDVPPGSTAAGVPAKILG